MGQYYRPIFLGDDVVHESVMEEGGYCVPEIIRGWLCSWMFQEGSKLMEHSYLNGQLVNTVEWLLRRGGQFYMTRIVWAGDYADEERVYNMDTDSEINNTLYSVCAEDAVLHIPGISEKNVKEYHYIVNHTKKMYVDKRCCGDQDIHPLPLLTCEGNGRGGGDYHGSCEEYVGTWARDIISVEKTLDRFPEYTQLEVVFEE